MWPIATVPDEKNLLQTQELDNSSFLANILFYLTHDAWDYSDLRHSSKGAAGNGNWTISVSILLFCRQCKSKEIMQNTTSSSTLQHIYRRIASVAVMSWANLFLIFMKKRVNKYGCTQMCSNPKQWNICLLHVYWDNKHTLLVMQHIYRPIASVAVMSIANLFLIFMKKELTNMAAPKCAQIQSKEICLLHA